MIRLIPPVAPAVTPWDVAASALRARSGDAARFAENLAAAMGVRTALLFGSGRAALTAWLRSIPRGDRDEVLVPAYTCWSVPSAVVRAGFRVRVVDVNPLTLDVDESALRCVADGRIAAAIGAHLFSTSCRVDRLAKRFGSPGGPIAILEDGAQVWPGAPGPATIPVLMSFGRGKPLALGHGGALLLDDVGGVRQISPARGGQRGAIALAAVSALAQPWFYKLPESLPFLGIGTTCYNTSFTEDEPFREWQGSLGLALLGRVARAVATRTRNARRLLEVFGCPVDWVVPVPGLGEGPIRLPLLAPSRRVRELFSRAMRSQGVAAVPMYPSVVSDISGISPSLANPDEPLPGARAVAERLVTLPTHPGLGMRDLDRIGYALRFAIDAAGRG